MRVDTYDRRSELCANNPMKREEGRAKAMSSAERYGFVPLPKKRVPELTGTDNARGRGLDERVRQKLGVPRHDEKK
jgi:hypothetical protein